MERKIGCLIIHGFGGSIREVKPFKEALELNGYITKCPPLKGHTGIKADLKFVTYQDWVTSAEEELICLKNECDQVFIAGFSMGGLIGIRLALKYKVDGLITINTPIFYLDIKKICSNIIHDLKTRDYSNIKRYLKPSNRLPIKALWNFRLLLTGTKSLIRQLKVPLMVVQAIDDDVVQHRSAGYIYRHASSDIKQLATYARGGHVILLGEMFPTVMKDIFTFLEDQAVPIEQRA
jgi:carboxylesterase